MLMWGKLSIRMDFHGFKSMKIDHRLEYVLFVGYGKRMKHNSCI